MHRTNDQVGGITQLLNMKLKVLVLLLFIQHATGVSGGSTCETIPQSACPYTMSTRTGSLMQFVPKHLTRDHPDYDAMVPKDARNKIKLYCAHPDCYSNPCNNGGTCTETFDGHTCSCNAEYAGIHCENPICPSDWIYATRKCFYVVDPSDSVVMQDAVDFCNNMGFVTLGNGQQREPSLVFVENSNEYNLLDSYVEGTWMWMNCRKIGGIVSCYKDRHLTTSDYRNWDAGEPSNGPTETCVSLKMTYGKMHDFHCTFVAAHVCQIIIG